MRTKNPASRPSGRGGLSGGWGALLGMLVLVAPTLAVAGGSATIQAVSPQGEVRMDVSWRSNHMRMDLPQGENTYMLLRDGKAYSVSEQGGRMIVFDMSALGEMGKQMGAGPDVGPADFGSLDRLEPTGEQETVAGIGGEVYEVVWTDGQGGKHEDTAVLSEDARVRELTVAFRRVSEALGANADPLGEALSRRNAGVLRFSDKYEVVSISADAPPAGDFELPAKPMTLQDMMRGMR